MERSKIILVLSWLLFVISMCSGIYIVVFWFNNDHLTAIQLLKEIWYILLLMVASYMGIIALDSIEDKHF